jgi:hypothetical protein
MASGLWSWFMTIQRFGVLGAFIFRAAMFSAALTLCGGIARAGDPFSLDATGSSSSVNVAGNSLPKLTTNLIESKGQFASLSGQTVSASLNYGGVDNAIQLTRNASGTTATLTIPSTGFTKTYNTSSAEETQKQINHDLKQGTLNTYSQFLGLINDHTSIGVTDGNPLATTALMADSSYYTFGFIAPKLNLKDYSGLPKGFDFHVNGGTSDSNKADGYWVEGGGGFTFRINERLALSLNLDFLYRNVQGANIYNLSNTDGLEIMIIKPALNGDGLSWVVTPAFAIGGGWSYDLAAGGIPIGGQVTSALAYQAGAFTFVLANQYGFYDGLPISWNDFKYDTDVNQQIIKNGVQVVYHFGNAFADAGLSYTNFLQSAAIPNYFTPDVGIGVRLGGSSSIRVGYHGDFGDGFTDSGGNLSFLTSF